MSECLVFDGALRDSGGAVTRWPPVALLGHPVAHSLSPILHRAAFAADGRDGEYCCVDVVDSRLEGALDDAKSQGVRGLNVTVPHKGRALGLAERGSAEAVEVGAANTLVCDRRGAESPEWVAHNTDSRGLAMALERMLGRQLRAALRSVLVLGSGGAARAAVHCARGLGALEIAIASRSRERTQWALDGGISWHSLSEVQLSGVGLVLQCTSLGLNPEDPSPLRLEGASEDLVVYDLVYASGPTSLLREARQRGLRCEDGRAMLVAQAALAYSMWFGGLPPVTTMAGAMGLDWDG